MYHSWLSILLFSATLLVLSSPLETLALHRSYPACAGYTSQYICHVSVQGRNGTRSAALRHNRHDGKTWSALLRPSVLYLSFHQGTAMDLWYVFDKLGVKFKWVIPKHLPYGVTQQHAKDDHERFSEYQCGLFDFIIVGDTVARARALLEHGCLQSQIILHVTQRFDAGMEGPLKDEWISLLQKASATMPNVRMVINNPYELWYMQHVRNAAFFSPQLIRPSGHWPAGLMPTAPLGNSSQVALVIQNYIPYLNEILLGNMTRLGVPFTELRHGKYGGSQGLAQYRCAVQIPYQVSVMAMYENLAAGVVLMVPSQKFYSSMAPALVAHGVGLHLADLPTLQSKAGSWEAMEWFNDYFKDAFVHFHSWQQLQQLLAPDRSYAQHQQRLRQFMRRHTAEVVSQWDEMLWCRQECQVRHLSTAAAAAGAPGASNITQQARRMLHK